MDARLLPIAFKCRPAGDYREQTAPPPFFDLSRASNSHLLLSLQERYSAARAIYRSLDLGVIGDICGVQLQPLLDALREAVLTKAR